jgi:hypothetical protein
MGYSNQGRPSQTGKLEAHTPQPSSRIRTSPGAGSGSGNFFNSIVCGAAKTAAVIEVIKFFPPLNKEFELFNHHLSYSWYNHSFLNLVFTSQPFV